MNTRERRGCHVQQDAEFAPPIRIADTFPLIELRESLLMIVNVFCLCNSRHTEGTAFRFLTSQFLYFGYKGNIKPKQQGKARQGEKQRI